MNKEVLVALQASLDAHRTCALVTITESSGSSPARTGQMMLVHSDGSFLGTCGGGQIEHTLIQNAVQAIKDNESQTFSYALKDVGMACGGKVEAFIDVESNEKHLIIVGAGHVGRYVYKLAAVSGFSITIVEDRKEFANPEEYPEANIIFGDLEEVLPTLETDGANVVVVTRGGEVDILAMRHLLGKDYRYLGLIGSKRKIIKIYDALKEEGIDPTKDDRVYAPIGIGIATKDPAEIAVGILAEIIQLKNNGRLEHMRFESN